MLVKTKQFHQHIENSSQTHSNIFHQHHCSPRKSNIKKFKPDKSLKNKLYLYCFCIFLSSEWTGLYRGIAKSSDFFAMANLYCFPGRFFVLNIRPAKSVLYRSRRFLKSPQLAPESKMTSTPVLNFFYFAENLWFLDFSHLLSNGPQRSKIYKKLDLAFI